MTAGKTAIPKAAVAPINGGFSKFEKASCLKNLAPY
nr:MAG TPA: hypothetical protein [Caudoviricetes sp.]